MEICSSTHVLHVGERISTRCHSAQKMKSWQINFIVFAIFTSFSQDPNVSWLRPKAEAFRAVISACEKCGESEEARDGHGPILPLSSAMAPWHRRDRPCVSSGCGRAIPLLRRTRPTPSPSGPVTWRDSVAQCVWKACMTITTPKKFQEYNMS